MIIIIIISGFAKRERASFQNSFSLVQTSYSLLNINQTNQTILFYCAPKSWPESWPTLAAAHRNN